MDDILDVYILLVIRKQGDILPSLYAQNAGFHKRSGLYQGGFEDFISYFTNTQNGQLMDYLNYNKVAEAYTQYFGEDNVGVFPMESLFDHEQNPLKKSFYHFLGYPYHDDEPYVSIKKNQRSFQAGQSFYYNINQETNKKKCLNFLKSLKFQYLLGPLRKTDLYKKMIQSLYKEKNRSFRDFEITGVRKTELTAMYNKSNKLLAKKNEIQESLLHYGYITP